VRDSQAELSDRTTTFDGNLDRRDNPVSELDQSIIDDLLVLGGSELLEELATLCCEDITRATRDLDQGLTDNDAPAVVRAAHSIAGVSAGIGATRLSDIARKLEKAARPGDLVDAGVLRVELVACWGQVLRALEELTVRNVG
jgi:HPt (histidine-containing phosphotransfer) domain-containing protein